MAEKFYAVKKGLMPGIYRSWDECKKMVHGYPEAVYKSFKTLEQAEEFMASEALKNGHENGMRAEERPSGKEPYAFVDGSFNEATGFYGYGGFLVYDGAKETLQGSGNREDMVFMRNVAGEISGSMAAVKRAVELGLPELTLYYDYMGIEMWAVGAWKRNKEGTKAYYDYICSVKNKIKLNFVKVKGHSGIEGNEEADKLAKAAVGIR